MKTRTLQVSFIVLALMTAFAQAQSDSPKNESGSNELVVGDWYDVTIERHGVKQEADGMLVKVTDDWVVLGKVLKESTDVKSGVPYLRDMPGVGRMFGKTTRVA